MSRKYRKHSTSDLLSYINLLEEGYSVNYVRNHYGIGGRQLQYLWEQYQQFGRSAIEKKSYSKLSIEIKVQAIKDYEIKHLSLVEIMTKYGISCSVFYQWRKKFHSGGVEALSTDGRGKPPCMGRPKKKTFEQMTEVERLQRENQELKTEIALLKKVRALVEERNAHLREIGQGPSKN